MRRVAQRQQVDIAKDLNKEPPLEFNLTEEEDALRLIVDEWEDKEAEEEAELLAQTVQYLPSQSPLSAPLFYSNEEDRRREELFYSYIVGEDAPSHADQEEFVQKLATLKEENAHSGLSMRGLLREWRKLPHFESMGLGPIPDLLSLLNSVTDSTGADSRMNLLSALSDRYKEVIDSSRKKIPTALQQLASQLGLNSPSDPHLRVLKSVRILLGMEKGARGKEGAELLEDLLKRVSGKNEMLLRGYITLKLAEQLEEHGKTHD